MNKLLNLIGYCAIIYLIVTKVGYVGIELKSIVGYILQFFGFICFVLVCLYFLTRKQKNKIALIKGFIGNDVNNATNTLIKEINDKNLKSSTLVSFGTTIFLRLTRIGLIGLIFGVIPILLLWQQNQLIKVQNSKISHQVDLMKVQNERIQLQNQLLDTERKSSYVFLMSNILDQIDIEIREQRAIWNSNPRKGLPTLSLTQSLKNRIVILSRSLKPYKVLEDSILSKKMISPERGQLFYLIMSNNFHQATKQNIASMGDFSYSEIGTINLSRQDLRKAALSHCYMKKSQMMEIDFRGADLEGSDLSNSDLRGANFDAYIEKNGTTSKTNLESVKFNKCNLSEVNFSGADLKNADLSYSTLKNINFNRTILKGVNFRGVELINCDFKDCIGLDWMQFSTVKKMASPKNMNDSLIIKLKKEFPCLFTIKGCR